MHTLDIFFVVIGIVFLILGFRRGLVSELFRLIALIAGFLSAYLYYPKAAGYLNFVPPQLSFTLAFILLFIVTAMVILGIGWAVRKMVHLTPFGWIDSFFGGLIGLIKTVIVFWMLCLAFSMFPFTLNKLTLHGSMVFQTYKNLPRSLQLSGLTGLRGLLKPGSVPPAHRPTPPNKRNHESPAGEHEEKNDDSAQNVI
jgi:uncharacterized membrane protein required for colicin V production